MITPFICQTHLLNTEADSLPEIDSAKASGRQMLRFKVLSLGRKLLLPALLENNSSMEILLHLDKKKLNAKLRAAIQ